MNTFLEYVARDIIAKHGDRLARIAVVFPNKRAALFLNEHLARMAGRPIWSPAYITISELFRRHSDKTTADQIKLVCDLHRCFTECTGIDETLDHFYGWGQLLLADFDDVDKNMARADKVFANLRDIHELDDVSYLSAGQVEMIKHFFSNFSEEHNTELKRRFLSLWSHIYDIYRTFNERLAAQGLAYEGALYREVAENGNIEFEYDKYIFVGFNMLQKVEQKLFERLQKEGRACFYWDFDHYYMPHLRPRHHGQTAAGYGRGETGTYAEPHRNHEAGRYIAEYSGAFPNCLDTADEEVYGNFGRAKDITFISAPTENAQARYVSRWLRGNGRIEAGRRTAVVMCDEGLLQTVIHCLPDEADKVNITTGWPLSQSPVASLVSLLIALQTTGYVASADKYRLQSVNAVLRHPYMRHISAGYAGLLKALNTDAKIYYPTPEQLCSDEGTSLLFGGLGRYEGATVAGRITEWLIDVTRLIAANASDSGDQLFKEALFRTYTLLNRLCGLMRTGELTIDVITLQRLAGQLMRTTTIPFHGEPVVGVQVMGVLETRNLDFDHVLILSANEGNMPKGVNDTSFIPYSIRKAHELTTVDNKVAIYAYYFYRLIQRASDVTILYNNSTENGTTGEMSRFMLQILVESGHHVARRTLQTGQQTTPFAPVAVAKTGEVTDRLLGRFDISRQQQHDGDEAESDMPLLTPTAVNRYMRCPKQFYYNYVCGLKEPDDDDGGEIDNRVFGNIFHAASQKIYGRLLQKSHHITASDLKWLLDHGGEIERTVDETFCEELFRLPPDSGARPGYNGLQLINRQVIITYLRRLLTIDMQQAPFDIIELESDVVESMEVEAGTLRFSTSVGGRIDRLDRVCEAGTGERIRVIDYKTGSRRLKAMTCTADIFDPAKIHDHSDYYLQTFLYSRIVRRSALYNPRNLPVSPALLFIQHAAAGDYDPTLCFGREPVTDIATAADEFNAMFRSKVNEIFNPDIPFRPTDDTGICTTCPYMQLCGSDGQETGTAGNGNIKREPKEA